MFGIGKLTDDRSANGIWIRRNVAMGVYFECIKNNIPVAHIHKLLQIYRNV